MLTFPPALRHRHYTAFLVAGFVSGTGLWMQRVAQDIYTYGISGRSATALGGVVAAQFIPTLVVTPLAGRLLDRFSRQTILAAANAWMAVAAAGLGLTMMFHQLGVWELAMFACAFGVGAAVEQPANHAVVSRLVDDDAAIDSAVSLTASSRQLTRLVGPVLAGVAVVVWGPPVAILVNSVTYVPLIAVLLMSASLKFRSPTSTPGAGLSLQQTLRGSPEVVTILISVAIMGTFAQNLQYMLTVLTVGAFDNGAAVLGVASAFVALGGVVAGVVSASTTRTADARSVLLRSLVFAVLLVVLAWSPTVTTFVAACFVLGFASTTSTASANSFVQRAAPDGVRGRVMALYTLVFTGGTPLGVLVLGVLGDTFGQRWAMASGGGVAAAALLLLLLLPARLLRRSTVVPPVG